MIAHAAAEFGIELRQRLKSVTRRLRGRVRESAELHVPQPAVGIMGDPTAGRTGGLRMLERSGSSISPYLISCTREKPCSMTSMFEVTTASPKRPNFF